MACAVVSCAAAVLEELLALARDWLFVMLPILLLLLLLWSCSAVDESLASLGLPAFALKALKELKRPLLLDLSGGLVDSVVSADSFGLAVLPTAFAFEEEEEDVALTPAASRRDTAAEPAMDEAHVVMDLRSGVP